MKTLRAAFALALLSSAASAAHNELTPAEKKAGWQLLFDGQTLTGWRPFNKKTAPVTGWEVVDGTLHALPKSKGDAIITVRKFRDFEFSWDWKLAPKGNNGVKYFVTEARPKSPGPEYQMIDDAGHPDGRLGADRQTAAFYEVLPPAPDKPLRPIGEWNTSKIVVQGRTVEHWLNGRKVLTWEIGSDAVKAGIAESKFKHEAGFGDKIEGHLMLTYHNDDCWFRNLK
ncbi:MAG: DUF1080 domain-containing protein, partial [Verrucomicrobia bacterium]|nr:DUF1080 domain-containing protein [Verrucomicrobiota bacterium]